MSYNEYMRNYMQGYSARRRERVIEILGGACSVCGSTDSLEVHHIDQSEKSFTLGSRWHGAWSAIEEELKKCKLLCDPCHTDQHRSKYPCGTPHRYWRGCRCDDCRTAVREYHREYLKNR